MPLDKEIKKFLKDLTIGKSRIAKIAAKLDLPYWWTESVVIEYFPCRRFGQNGKLYQFDFDIFENSLVDTIGGLKVIIPHYILFQNINPKDLSYRAPRLMVGEYAEPLDKANLIPEGIVNSSAFPFVPNLLGTVDPKMGFNGYAIVYDDGNFYQYKIAELYEINKRQTWFKSNLFDLMPLYKTTERLRMIGNDIKNNKDTNIIDKIEKLYRRLENIRKPIRSKILKYHETKKTSKSPVDTKLPPPPLLTFIDSLKQTNSGYEIESHIESLMYEAAIENFRSAVKSRKDQKNSTLHHDAFLNEIKYSILCVICCITCLESYINFVFKKYLPDEYKTFERTSTPRQKWLYVPLGMNLGFKFDLTKDPFKTFSDMVKWRNDAIHNTPQFSKIQGFKTKEDIMLICYPRKDSIDNLDFWIRRIEEWNIGKKGRYDIIPKLICRKFVVFIPGVTEEDILVKNEGLLLPSEVQEALNILKGLGLIEPKLFGREIRYIISDKQLDDFVAGIKTSFISELYYLLTKWEWFKIPTPEEKERMESIFGKSQFKSLSTSLEIKLTEHKKDMKRCKNIDEYFQLLTKASDTYQKLAADTTLQMYKESRTTIPVTQQEHLDDVKRYHQYLRIKLEQNLSELIMTYDEEGIEGLKMDFEEIILKYSFLNDILANLCPKVFESPNEELQQAIKHREASRQLAAQEFAKQMNAITSSSMESDRRNIKHVEYIHGKDGKILPVLNIDKLLDEQATKDDDTS